MNAVSTRTHRTRRGGRRSPENVVFRAISDPTRREILGLLRAGDQTVAEIAINFRISRPAVSKHLRILRSAGLVQSRKFGTSRRCRLTGSPLQTVHDWLQDYATFWACALEGLKNYVERDDGR